MDLEEEEEGQREVDTGAMDLSEGRRKVTMWKRKRTQGEEGIEPRWRYSGEIGVAPSEDHHEGGAIPLQLDREEN